MKCSQTIIIKDKQSWKTEDTDGISDPDPERGKAEKGGLKSVPEEAIIEKGFRTEEKRKEKSICVINIWLRRSIY